jgi:3-dehydroquinate synthase
MTWRGRNIYLVGLPGAGKSAIGEHAAGLLSDFGYEFVDLDREIESDAGATIAEIFAAEGETEFRNRETNALLDVSRHAFRNPKVVATGGGIVLNALNRTIMRGSGLVVWIDVSVREAAKNIFRDIESDHSRPLIGAGDEQDVIERVRQLHDERRPFYEQATLHFVYKSAGQSERTPEELASELVKALGEMSFHVGLKPRFETLVAGSAIRNYPILIGNGVAPKELSSWLRERGREHVVMITDDIVANIHLEQFLSNVARDFGPTPPAFATITLESGEQHKNLAALQEVLQSLHELGATRRKTTVVALGGGVVTDLAGLAANLYHRGLEILYVPTTLLAQVDAAIGGKTGVDAFGVKNLLGTIHPPNLVIVDPLFLQTLPKRELIAGLPEMLKYGLIGSRPLWTKLATAITRLTRGIDPEYPFFISEAIDEKLRYVERDEFERDEGIRELLNFGHTFGHALEAATDFERYLHGEAVLIGMRTAAWLSQELGCLSNVEYDEIESVLRRVPIVVHATVTAAELLTHLKHDKKRGREPRFVLLRSIGDAFVTPVAPDQVMAALAYMSTIL